MNRPLHVLFIQDNDHDLEPAIHELKRAGHQPVFQRVETKAQLEHALQSQEWDVILSDHKMAALDSLAALECVKNTGKDIPFILFSGSVGEEAAVTLFKAGVRDYVHKDNLSLLVTAIEQEIKEAKHRHEHKKLEEQLRQSQKMEAFGQLAGGIAHDFNNLLTSIVSPAEVLLKRLLPNDPHRRWVELIHQAGSSAVQLVRQLLLFSRRDVAQHTVHDLNEVLTKLEQMLSRIISAQIELKVATSPIPATVCIDTTQFEQVIINLAVNARDAMPGGGLLDIAMSVVTLDDDFKSEHPELDARRYVRVTVRDNGTGMSEEVKKRIFEPFFTTKEPGKGTGLGLATCFGIIKKSRGHIDVESELGKGTIFKLYLPLAEDVPATGPHSDKEGAAFPKGNETILFVEDDTLVKTMGSLILREQGFTVLEARRGDEALKILMQAKPDSIHLLLTDWVMPGMSGYELAKRAHNLWPHLPVIYMSGYAEDSLTGRNLDDPSIDLILKPYSAESLLSKIREVLDRQHQFPPKAKTA